jgi:hypothetical protein
MLTSPHGDGAYGTGVNYKVFAHLWEYYMTGAFGEEIVQLRIVIMKFILYKIE